MWNPAHALSMTTEQERVLEAWVNAPTSPQYIVMRSRICLMAHQGLPNRQIATDVGTSRPTVLLWRRRFAEGGPSALEQDAARGESAQRLESAQVKAIVEATLHTRPKDATQWSTRSMAKRFHISHMTVARIWDAHGLQPHRVRTFKLSRDPQFVEKLTDVVGLYLNPPDKALVLCVDEKSQIQALDRTQPGLPMKKGRCGTMTLFAALNVLEGTVIGGCFERHRHEEFLKFLRQIDRQTPARLALHLIVDNYGTHTHENVQQWLTKHPRFHLHFTPTSSSWLNLVERWFAEITRKQIRRGIFHSVEELISVIEQYIKHNNKHPKPFIWTKRVDEILDKVRHCKAASVTQH
jgi:transposase